MWEFPAQFVWGAATSALQIEGSAHVDGRGDSIWDVFCRTSGRVWLDHSPETACDHYQRFAEDVEHMRRMGLNGYRFSISWPRIFPDGIGKPNQKGLDFYDRLIDGLIAAGIEPYATLFHWDLPYDLHCRGGWLNRDSAHWFAEYAACVARRYSGKVSQWITLNEPQIFVGMGYERGLHAPGLQLPVSELLSTGHHILLAHGRASQALRANSSATCRIAMAPHAIVHIPWTDSASDREAARHRMFAFEKKTSWSNSWWADPVFFGSYPSDMLDLCAHEMPRIDPDDMDTIHQPPDFCGLNLYAGSYVRAGQAGKPEDVPWPVNIPLNAFRMVVTPEAMYWGVKWFYERYRKPIVITENGASCTDWVSLDGQVHDPQRIDYTARYLAQMRRAMEEGIPVHGYFHWSLLDNFEWSEGYKERLGLIYVDFETQERIWKDSAFWYQHLIETRGAALSEIQAPSKNGEIVQ